MKKRRNLRFAALVGATMLVGALPSVGAAVGNVHSPPTCFGKPATILGDASDEDLVGTEAADVIIAAGGDDSIHGLGGHDVLCGGAGRDRIDGGSGGDDLLGFGGRDVLLGGSGNDALNGGWGKDRLRGLKGHDTLTGDNVPVNPDVRDDCWGGPGKDRVFFC